MRVAERRVDGTGDGRDREAREPPELQEEAGESVDVDERTEDGDGEADAGDATDARTDGVERPVALPAVDDGERRRLDGVLVDVPGVVRERSILRAVFRACVSGHARSFAYRRLRFSGEKPTLSVNSGAGEAGVPRVRGGV